MRTQGSQQVGHPPNELEERTIQGPAQAHGHQNELQLRSAQDQGLPLRPQQRALGQPVSWAASTTTADVSWAAERAAAGEPVGALGAKGRGSAVEVRIALPVTEIRCNRALQELPIRKNGGITVLSS